MNEQRAQVRNAADPQQVGRAARRDKDKAEIERAAMKAVLSTSEGRLVMWSLLEGMGVFRSIWTPSAEIHYRAGWQDAGHQLQALILQADEELYDLMCREARVRAKRAANETDAAHTARAEQGAK